MAEHNYKFNVTMTCGGCSGAVERVLKKLDGAPFHTTPHYTTPSRPANDHCLLPGVKSFDVSLDSQSANVVTEDSVDYATVLEKIKKTGKKVNSGEADGVPQSV